MLLWRAGIRVPHQREFIDGRGDANGSPLMLGLPHARIGPGADVPFSIRSFGVRPRNDPDVAVQLKLATVGERLGLGVLDPRVDYIRRLLRLDLGNHRSLSAVVIQ